MNGVASSDARRQSFARLGKLEAARRARVVRLEPLADALAVEEVAAAEPRDALWSASDGAQRGARGAVRAPRAVRVWVLFKT